MKDITMPSFGADMAKGEVAEWKVKPGDTVKKGDIIASIETMKGLIDMEVFDNGVIDSLLATVGEELVVGQVIAKLRLANEPVTAEDHEDKVLKKAKKVEDSAPETVLNQTSATYVIRHRGDELLKDPQDPKVRKKISPLALKTAQQQGMNWQQIGVGSGPSGAIVLADITAALPIDTVQSADSTDTISEPSKSRASQTAADDMRQAIAAVVSQSKRDIPHYYLQQDICLDKVQYWLTQHNKGLSSKERILSNALIYCAIAKALTDFPQFNGFYKGGEYQAQNSIHLGNVINLRQGGIIVAAIHDSDELNPLQMMEKIKDQVVRAREGGLRMSEMQDSTITVSNLGERGVDSIQSIIFPPQVAIIGLGKVRTAPWVVEQQVISASITTLSLAADHRVSDGHSGARLLNKIDKLLQKPEALI
jgi:pyruvate dehydrogenase E2 component (dihydrolipoamide acetyltransferase)